MPWTKTWAAVALIIAGCGKDDLPGRFAPFDMAARQNAWHGAWVLPRGEVWWAVELGGGKAKLWTPERELEPEVVFESPCSLLLIERVGKSSMGWQISYALHDGEIWAAFGGISTPGAVVGQQVVMCEPPAGQLSLAADGTCTRLDPPGLAGGPWTTEPATCGLRGGEFYWKDEKNDKDDLEREHTIPVVGDSLIDDTLARSHGEKATDFAAAKARAAELNRAK